MSTELNHILNKLDSQLKSRGIYLDQQSKLKNIQISENPYYDPDNISNGAEFKEIPLNNQNNINNLHSTLDYNKLKKIIQNEVINYVNEIKSEMRMSLNSINTKIDFIEKEIPKINFMNEQIRNNTSNLSKLENDNILISEEIKSTNSLLILNNRELISNKQETNNKLKQISDNLEQLSNKINEISNNHNFNEIKNNNNNFSNEIQMKINSQFGKFSEEEEAKLEILRQNLFQKINDNLDQQENEFNEMKKNIIELQNNMKMINLQPNNNNVVVNVGNNDELLNKIPEIKNMINNFENKLNEINNKIETIKEQPIQENNNKNDNIYNDVIANYNNMKIEIESLNETYNQNHKKLKSDIQNLNESINKLKENENKKEIINENNKIDEENIPNNEVNNIRNNIKYLEKKINALENNFKNLDDNINDNLAEVRQLKNKIGNTNTNININNNYCKLKDLEKVSNEIRDLNNKINTLEKDFNGKISETNKTYNNTINNINMQNDLFKQEEIKLNEENQQFINFISEKMICNNKDIEKALNQCEYIYKKLAVINKNFKQTNIYLNKIQKLEDKLNEIENNLDK